MEAFAWFDAVGLCGVAVILGAHFGLQSGRLDGLGRPYQWLNIIGSLLVLVSLYYKPNLSSITIQVAWIVISFYGMWRAKLGGRAKPAD
jgi:paired small multidrug resistance pump